MKAANYESDMYYHHSVYFGQSYFGRQIKIQELGPKFSDIAFHQIPASPRQEVNPYDENLPDRVAEIGRDLCSGLQRLIAGHPLVGDVRGLELVVSAEMIF